MVRNATSTARCINDAQYALPKYDKDSDQNGMREL